MPAVCGILDAPTSSAVGSLFCSSQQVVQGKTVLRKTVLGGPAWFRNIYHLKCHAWAHGDYSPLTPASPSNIVLMIRCVPAAGTGKSMWGSWGRLGLGNVPPACVSPKDMIIRLPDDGADESTKSGVTPSALKPLKMSRCNGTGTASRYRGPCC